MRGFLKLAVAVLGFQIAGTLVAAAHEGHDHDAPPPPVSTTVAPRMEASSGDFELVAISGSSEVVIYLDAFRSNEPVTQPRSMWIRPGRPSRPRPRETGFMW